MSVWKKILQALAGLLLAAGVCLAVGNWRFAGEKDLIFTFRGARISVCGLGAGLSLLTLLGFADAWIGFARRETGGFSAGRLINSLGFAILPALTVWKLFEQGTALGAGKPVEDPLKGLIPDNGPFSAGGLWLPGYLEAACALLLFAAVVLWLILRRQALPENGDLAGVTLAAWCALRILTEGLRSAEDSFFGIPGAGTWAAAGMMALITGLWALRILRQKRNTGFVAACVPVFLATAAGILLIRGGVIRTGNAAADLAAEVILALLAAKAVLCLGRVGRN